jgi:hypothetical protein
MWPRVFDKVAFALAVVALYWGIGARAGRGGGQRGGRERGRAASEQTLAENHLGQGG